MAGSFRGAYALNALLKAGLDIEKTGWDDETVLHRAAGFGHHEHVGVLLGWDADVLAQDHLNWTPLHHAVAFEARNLDVIEALVAEGADPNALTLEDETPVQLAWKVGHETHAPALERLARASGRPSLPIRPRLSAGQVTIDGQR